LKRDDILSELSKEAWLHEACQNIGGILSDDLKQELFIILCAKSNEEIEQIHTGGYLRYYCIRLLIRLHDGNGRQKFHRQFRTVSHSLPENYEAEDEQEYDAEIYRKALQAINFASAAKELDRSEWYVRKMWEIYTEDFSMLKISRTTKINYREIINIIQTIKGQVLREYDRLSR
jgi:hypothetical protein